MNYRELLERHWETGADVTLAITLVAEEKAQQCGLVLLDEQGWVREFREQPRGGDLKQMRVAMREGERGREGETERGRDAETGRHGDAETITALLSSPPRAVAASRRRRLAPSPFDSAASLPDGEAPCYLASMGIYVFQKAVLKRLLDETQPTFDFGMELIPKAVQTCKVQSHLFQGYWENIGTLSAFYRANLDLALPEPKFSFYDPVAPIYTRPRLLPPAKVRECRVTDCLLAEGAILSGAELTQCVVGVRTRIQAGARLERTIIMGADRYQTIEEINQDRARGRPLLGIGEEAVIRQTILDKNVRIGAGVRITNDAGRMHFDGNHYYIRDGIVVIPRDATIAEGEVI
jgi:glucose-1-phosphate adenylyltransferase